MCGGQLFILPCSRVGHVSKHRPPNQPELTKAMTYNSLRLVHIWLDEYKVREMSLICKDEQEHRTELGIKEPVPPFQITSVLKLAAHLQPLIHLPQTLFSISSFEPITDERYFSFQFLGKLKFLRRKLIDTGSLFCSFGPD